MIVWIASAGRSGNTFFRIIMHHVYGVRTYAAFNASEVLVAAGTGSLVGAEELPPSLKKAMATADREQIRHALEELDKSDELYVFKTHAEAQDLFGTQCRAILIVRDGRDALTSYAHYLVDLRFDAIAFRHRLRRMARSRSELLKAEGWTHLIKIILVSGMRWMGLRKRLVSWRIDQLLT
ncbi:MAG: sulfotransferase domain-containing protein, partial [Verrucomicrobiota bacterium]|nr:sulfotransferase domain-containing protein [Verrucomicrobiota bacterium]